MHVSISDNDGDESTPKIDTPITLNKFLCGTVGVAFNKEDPVAGSAVTEEVIVLDPNYAITNDSASVAT